MLGSTDLENAPRNDGRVDYGAVIPFKDGVLRRAFDAFQGATREQQGDFKTFCETQAYWLDDYALFMALKEAHGGQPWNTWDEPLRTRKKRALATFAKEYAEAVLRHKVWQWFFYGQWLALKTYANSKNIKIIGDIPIFIAYDSADAWANPELYFFDADGNPEVVAGVPPDYFSATGQRWGNPIYRWKKMQNRDFAWWVVALSFVFGLLRPYPRRSLSRVRVVLGDSRRERRPPNRADGSKAPVRRSFDTLKRELGDLPIIAEDLGIITPEVEAFARRQRLAGDEGVAVRLCRRRR